MTFYSARTRIRNPLMPSYILSFDGYIVVEGKDEDDAFSRGHKLFGSLIERSGYDMGVTILDVTLE
jgi:hypothetical protein